MTTRDPAHCTIIQAQCKLDLDGQRFGNQWVRDIACNMAYDRAGADLGANAIDSVVGQEERYELSEVKPLVRGVLYSPIIEIEAIHIDVSPHGWPQTKAETARRRSRAQTPKRLGGYYSKYINIDNIVNVNEEEDKVNA